MHTFMCGNQINIHSKRCESTNKAEFRRGADTSVMLLESDDSSGCINLVNVVTGL
jgi:hypothetical protein